MKKDYELTVIFAPVLKEQGLTSVISAVEGIVKKYKGKVLEFNDEGKQKLAYPLKKYREGIYVFWVLDLASDKVKEFENELKLQKGLLRHLLVVKE